MKLLKTLGSVALIAMLVFGVVALSLTSCEMPDTETKVATPVADPPGGTRTSASAFTVTLATATAGASIYYTIDGTDPTTSSTKYTTAINITQTTTIKAIGVKEGLDNSGIMTHTYTFPGSSVVMPVANPAGGTYFQTQNVTLSTTTTGATIRYTTDGTDPTATTGTQYTTAISIATTTTLKAIAVKDGATSNIRTAVYTIGTFETVAATAVELTVGEWKDDTLEAGEEHWFKFIAAATTHYIHFSGTQVGLEGTLNDAYVSLFTDNGTAVGTAQNNLYGSGGNTNTSRTVTSGQTYYIRVKPYGSNFLGNSGVSGTYKIASYTSTVMTDKPAVGVTVTTLTEGAWEEGIFAAAGNQWYKFTTTVAAQNIFFEPDTLSLVSVQLFNMDGSPVSTGTTLSYTTRYTSRTGLTQNTDYYIRVTNTSSAGGVYQIGFHPIGMTAPSIPNDATELVPADSWKDGNIAAVSGEQWFKFTASAASHYIHFAPGTLTAVDVQLYLADKTAVGSEFTLTYTTRYSQRTGLTASTDYYVRVRPDSSSATGTYKIGFNSQVLSPVVPTPASTTPLTNANTWYDGSIAAASGEQWFNFTTTATNANILFDIGSLYGVIVELYNNEYRLVTRINISTQYGQTSLSASTTSVNYTSLTNSAQYYIRVRPSSTTNNNGTYKLGFAASTGDMPSIIPAAADITQITGAGVWTNGNITVAGGQQWFKFTATISGLTNQYIHFSGTRTGLAGTLTDVYIQVYNATTGAPVSTPYNMFGNGSNTYINRTLTLDNDYYIRVWPSDNTKSGTYKLAFNTSSTRPANP